MKQLYITIQIHENGKKYAYARGIGQDTNLLKLNNIKNAEIIKAAQTQKEARETAERWNAIYKANGEYLFDTPAF